MKIDNTTLVFFDASCLIAAAGSPSGGSGFLLSLCAKKWLRGAVSHVVLLEVEHNIGEKLGDEVLERYHNLLVDVPLALASVPPIPPDAHWLQHVNEKDVHVVAALLDVHAPYLLTLDKRLIAELNQTTLSVQALSPGDFIRSILPLHVDYPKLR